MSAIISIIIPAHNPGAYLQEALRSVHQQSSPDWELVVVDDNSSEDLSWISREFPRAAYVRQSHGGVSVARNNGILRTSGRFICFMDQDDLWLPRKLERQVQAMERNPEAGVCYYDLDLIDSAGQRMKPGGDRTPAADEAVLVELDPGATAAGDDRSPLHRSLAHFSQRFVVPSTVMIRRQCLASSGLLDPFIPFSGDYDLLIKLGNRHKVIRVPHADVLYRKHDNNFSDQYEVGRGEVEAMVDRYVAFARAKGDHGLERAVAGLLRRPKHVFAAQAFDRARRSVRSRDYADAAKHLANAAWFSPTFVAGSLSRWVASRLPGRSRSA